MKPWVADAKDIGIVSEDDVVITPAINRFTAPQGRDNMFFVVAPKGVGKTLFLKYKRHLYQKKHKKEYQQEEIYFIPHSDLVDRHVGTIQFNLEKIDILRNTENWVNLWTSCISLSIIKHLKLIYEKKGDRVKEDALKAHIGHLPNELRKMIDNPLFVTPFGYLSAILNLNYKSINKILKKQYLLTETIKKVRSAVAVFIDNVDECFGEHLRTEFDTKGTFRGEVSSDIWYGAQIGLMLAIWELSGYEHLKIFASIRKEAFLKLLETDDRGLQIKGSTSDIKYSKEELRGIFIKNIKSMDNRDLVYPDYRESDPIYSFLGLERNKITNAWVSKTKEDIFDYIYRHTLKRPRDLMIIGAELANIGVTERGEENIRAKVDEASSDISRTYMQEMKPHLDFERFEGIFNLIHSNILTRRELREICREFNKQKTCENKNCKQCEKTHAFCNLYKLGLLGAVLADMGSGKMVQKFLGSGERVFESKILPYSKYYILHPILNSVIYERSTRIDRAPYYINPEIVVGDGYSWIDPRIYETNRYCSFINRVCKTERFLDKHGVFLAASYTNKDFIEVLSEKFGKRNLSLEIDKWMKIEDSGTGRIFCEEVCPKAFRNLWMIAEVSDFNPNVFFECGFAIGLGRTVTFLIDENAGMIKSKLGNLYLRYKTIEDITNKLELNPDKFNKIKTNSLYTVPRVFRDIDDFDLPNDRKKSDAVYVLSFNQQTDIIRNLSECGYKVVELNRLKQRFMPRDLVAELIDAKAVLVNLSGVQKEQNTNKLNDSQLMCLAGICVSQCVPVKIFQSNDNFYSDVREISIGGNSGKNLIEFVNGLSI